MTAIMSEISHLGDSIDDTNYFQILGKILMDSINQKDI